MTKEPIFKVLPYEPLRITSNYGLRTHPISGNKLFHSGIDIGPNKNDPPSQWFIRSVAQGVVKTVSYSASRGFYIICKHAGFYTLYQHLESQFVSEGSLVNPGDHIGLMGSSGDSTATHLHFELWGENKTPVDPLWHLENLKDEVDEMTEVRVREIIKDVIESYIYTEAEASDYAKKNIELVTQSGITTGERPRGLARREEVMVMIANTIAGVVNYIDENQED